MLVGAVSTGYGTVIGRYHICCSLSHWLTGEKYP